MRPYDQTSDKIVSDSWRHGNLACGLRGSAAQNALLVALRAAHGIQVGTGPDGEIAADVVIEVVHD